MTLAAGGKDGGKDDGADINVKWDRTGCARMERYPLPVIWSRAPRPP